MEALIFTVCFIVMVFFMSKIEEQQKQCHSKSSVAKKTMEEKGKVNIHMMPQTQREASGRNWEIYKNLVSNPTSLSSDSVNKVNIKKKSRRKYSFTPQNINQIEFNESEVKNDRNKQKLTKQIALDCEMVGIGDGTESMLARVSIVNHHGFCIYDKYVKPREPVQDYRTKVSGIRPHNLQNGEEFEFVQKEVAEILRGRILVGHALKHDLDVLYLSHPRKHQRDTSRFKLFRQISKGNTPSLKKLASDLLGKEIQTGEHSSIEDARAAMQLYMLYRNKWESEFYSRR